MCKKILLFGALQMLMLLVSCEIVDDDISKHTQDKVGVGLDAVAGILASVPIADIHLREVHAAVKSSSSNGYDEEYTMRDLFSSPGKGVGDKAVKSGDFMENPLRVLIERQIRSLAVKSSSICPCENPDAFLDALMDSDIQIYWPFSEKWDGHTYPIITFDPGDGSHTNEGYRVVVSPTGERSLESVVVDEKLASEEPVWVINRNSDAGFMTLELMRREDPDWGEGGGSIIVNPSLKTSAALSSVSCKAGGTLKSLILRDFTMKRNFDSWFAGASEFFIKAGYVKDFTASTEAEMKLYNPSITDFIVVVKRSQVGIPQKFNAMIVSDWSSQMENCAFMITEDDGGTRTEWKCTALVRIASKSYGFEVVLPFNTRDDIVWRGQLSSRWLESGEDVVAHFGDVDVTFGVI